MKNSHDIDLITKFSPQQPQQTAQQHPHNHFTPIRGFEEHNPLQQQQQKMIDPLMLSNDLSSIDEENDSNSLAEDDQERNALLEQLSSSNSFLLSTSATGGESGDDDDSEIKNYTKNDDLSERPYLLQGVSPPIWGTTHRQATIGPNTARTTEELIGDLSTDWQLLSSKTNNSQHYLPQQQQQHQVIATTTNGQTMMNLLNDNVLIQNNNNNSNSNIIYNGQNNNNNNNNSNDSNNINHVNSRSSSSSMNSISTNINRMNINTGATSTPNVQQPQQPIQYPTTNKNNTFQQPYFNQPQQQQQQQFNQSTSIASSSSSSQSSSSSPSMVSSLFITPSQVNQLNNNHYNSGGGAASNVLSNDMLVGNSSMMSMLSHNNNNSNTTITTPVNDEMCTCPLRSLLNCPWYGNKLSLNVHLEQSCFPRFLRENITAAENGLPQQPQHILFKVRDNIVAGMNQYFSRETILRNCAKQLQVPEVVCAEVWKWMRSSNESFFHAYDMITLVVGQIEIFNELAQEMQANQDTRYHFNDPNVGLLLSQQQQQQQQTQQTQSQVQQQQFLLHNESPMVGHQTTDSSNGATLSLDLSNQLLRQNYSQALTQTAGSQLPNSNASQQWSLLSQFQQMQQQTTLENNNNGRSSSAALNSPMTALSSRNQQVWIPQATSSMATNPMMNSGIAMGGTSAVGTTTPSNTSPVMVNQFVSGGAMANSRMRKDVTKSKALKFHNYKQPTATTPGGGSSRRRSESSTPISFVNYSVANPRNNNSQ